MKRATPDFSSRAARIEELHCADGRLPKADSSDPGEGELSRQHYLAEIRDSDPRKCLRIARKKLHSLHPLQQIRGRLLAGDLTHARRLLLRQPPTGEAAEWLLESSRLHAMEADWARCESAASQGLSSEPRSPTALALRQTRALARFERGDFGGAARDLADVRSAREVLPHSISAFYARASEVRLLARGEAATPARRSLDALWGELAQPQDSESDRVLTLLRTEADLARVLGKDSFEWALASALCARSIGDALYEALGWVEAWAACAGQPELRDRISRELAPALEAYPRIRRLLATLSSKSTPGPPDPPDTTTELGLWRHSRQLFTRPPLSALDARPWPRALLFQRSGWVAQLEPEWRLIRLPPDSRPWKAIALLAAAQAGELSKADWARRLWGVGKYVPHLHDGAVATLLHRIRRQSCLAASAEGEHVRLRDTLVLG